MGLNFPKVSIIAVCYNHEKYLRECLESIKKQTYSNIEVIIVDDCSADLSREIISEFCLTNPSFQYLFNQHNMGNCRSFNKAFQISTGKYVIDLSTDDVLMPKRIAQQVEMLEASAQLGVVTSDAMYIDKHSNWLGDFRQNTDSLKDGNIYTEILKKTFIMPCSIMIRRIVVEELDGYDETLAYEDFDFLIRSARICRYGHIAEILVKQRILTGSHSESFTKKGNQLTPSTVRVCAKALVFNESDAENEALIIRLKFVLRQCFFTENFTAGEEVVRMLEQLKGHNAVTRFFQLLNYWELPTNFLYSKYILLRRFIRFK